MKWRRHLRLILTVVKSIYICMYIIYITYIIYGESFL